MIDLPVYPFPQFEFSQNLVHPCTKGQPLIVLVFQFPNNNINMAVTQTSEVHVKPVTFNVVMDIHLHSLPYLLRM